MDPALIEFIKTLGQAAIFAFAANQFYKDGRAQDKLIITYLSQQNQMLLQAIMQQTFLKSPAIAPIMPSWMSPIPTDLGEPQSVPKSPAMT